MTTLSLREPSIAAAPSRRSADPLAAFVERSHARACALLVLLALACFLPGFASLQPMDRDEPRFAQATKQMLETGDFVDIRFQDEARHKKPVGIYWLQSAAVAAAEAAGVPSARTTIAVYRLPSLAGALATVLLTYWAALAFARRREAFLAAAFMGASVILMAEARLAKTDAVLAACSVAALGALARAYLGRGAVSLASAAAFWIAMAVGILVKGPMVVLFAGLCALVLCVREGSARWLLGLRPGPGLLFLLAAVTPWFVAIAMKSGGAFFAASAGQDLIGKVGSAQVQHWAPPGTYLLAFFGTFWPAAILTAIAVPYAWIHRRDDAIAVLAAWVVPSWLVFEAVPTKLPHYVLPLYPALAILTAIAIGRGFVGPGRPLAKPATLLLPLIPLALALGIGFGARALGDPVPIPALAGLAVAAAVAFAAWFAFLRGQAWRASLLSLPAAVLVAGSVLGFGQAALASLKLSPRLAAAAGSLACERPAYGTVGYREPSLVFLLGTDLALFENGREAADFLGQGPCRMVFVESRHEAAFRTALAERAAGAALATRVAGFNINGGRRLDIGVYRAAP